MVYSAARGAGSGGGGAAADAASAAADAARGRSIHHRQVPTMPRGNSSVTAMNSPPSMNSQ